MFIGDRVRMTVGNDVEVAGGRILLSINVVTAAGQVNHIYVGPLPRGEIIRSVPIPFCEDGCQVSGISVSGPGTLPEAMRGTLSIGDVTVDSSALPYFADVGWRGQTDSRFVYGKPVVTSIHSAGSTLTAELDSRDEQVVALLATQDVPAVLPVLMGRTARPNVVSRAGDILTVASAAGATLDIDPIGITESTPFLGPPAMLVDYTMYTRNNHLDEDSSVYILARADPPKSVLDQLAAAGVNGPITLAQVRHTLDQDAYALALRLYLIVTIIVILLALAGIAVNMAVQLPSRRRDAASLRVVGMRRRSIVASVAWEFTAVLGSAAVAGILAGALAQYVVVRTITLGYTDSLLTPRVLPSFDLSAVAAMLALTLALMIGVAMLLGSLTVRGARTATLRDSMF